MVKCTGMILVLVMTIWAEKPKVAYVITALCDNVHQGIVPVPEKLGNGMDPRNNLYWGALYGIKTFFRKSKDWKYVHHQKNPTIDILERVVFYNKKSNIFMIADAWKGKEIKKATEFFFQSLAVLNSSAITIKKEDNDISLPLYGGADLIAFVGHDGLMDFSLTSYPKSKETGKDAIVLACYSEKFFSEGIMYAKGRSILLTTGLMAPEAYTLDAALKAWSSRGDVVEAAARAYNKYQKCGLRGARRLFTSLD